MTYPAGGIEVTIDVQIAGTSVPMHGWTVNGTSQGHGGSADIISHMPALAAAGIDLVAMAVNAGSTGLPVDIFVTMFNQTYHLFGGQYVNPTFDYDTGDVTVHCRDWTSVLMDRRNVVNTNNRSLKDVWGQIAGVYGLSPNVEALADDDPDIGTIYGSPDTAWQPVPQTPWALIRKLARNNGYEAYVGPDKALVLTSPGLGNALQLCYQMNPIPNGFIPCRALKFTHNALRNGNFKVKTRSYDPHAAQITEGDASFGDGGGVPYQFHHDGLTASQVQQKADAIAADIGKREFTMSCEIDFLPSIVAGMPVSIDGPTINPILRAQAYSVGAYKHRLMMPSGERAQATLVTTITHERPTKGNGGTPGQDSSATD